MHPGAPAEPVLAAWGITTHGKPVLVGLAPGAREVHDAWADFLADWSSRGLRAPLLVITDGAPGLIGAVELPWPTACASGVWSTAPESAGQGPQPRPGRGQGRFWQIFDDFRRPSQARPRSPRPAGRDAFATATATATPRRWPA